MSDYCPSCEKRHVLPRLHPEFGPVLAAKGCSELIVDTSVKRAENETEDA